MPEINPTNCQYCEHHVNLSDPDPFDWFCGDDMKVKCNLANRDVAIAVRPYNMEKESSVPSWCPLRILG